MSMGRQSTALCTIAASDCGLKTQLSTFQTLRFPNEPSLRVLQGRLWAQCQLLARYVFRLFWWIEGRCFMEHL